MLLSSSLVTDHVVLFFCTASALVDVQVREEALSRLSIRAFFAHIGQILDLVLSLWDCLKTFSCQLFFRFL